MLNANFFAAVGIFGLMIGAALPVPSQAQDLDMKKVFRCGAKDKAGVAACDHARDLILANCTNCHAFVPIVIQQFDKAGWEGNFQRHRERATALNAAQLSEIRNYLAANFNPSQDPPELPEELLKEWTSY